jgi:cell division protein FtsW
MNKLFGNISSVLLLASLALWFGMILLVRWYAPPVETLGYLEVKAVKEGVVIGHDELAQRPGSRSADKRHLLITHNSDTGWMLTNISSKKKVDVMFQLLKRWKLQKGDTIQLAGTELEVLESDKGKLKIINTQSKHTAYWDGLLNLTPELSFAENCDPPENIVKRTLKRWKSMGRIPPFEPKEYALFRLGGSANCSDRWKISEVPVDTARVVLFKGSFWLRPGSDNSHILMARKSGTHKSFQQLSLPTSGSEGKMSSIVLGRTYYKISEIGKNEKARLVLTPFAKQDLWPLDTVSDPKVNEGQPHGVESHKKTNQDNIGIVNRDAVPKTEKSSLQKKDPPNVRKIPESWSWIGEGRTLLGWASTHWMRLTAGAFISILATIGLIFSHTFNSSVDRRQAAQAWRRTFTVGPSLFFCWLSFLFYKQSPAPDFIILMFLSWAGWFMASIVMYSQGLLQGSSRHVWAAATFLAGAGSILLFQIAAGAANTLWLGYVQKHIFALSVFSWGLVVLATFSDYVKRVAMEVLAPRNNVEWAFWLFWGVGGGLLLLMLFMQTVMGGEEGLFGIQPVELIKVLVVFLASILAVEIWEIIPHYQSPNFANMFKLRWKFLVYPLGVIIFALLYMSDFSPGLLISIYIAFWFWLLAYPPGHSHLTKLGFIIRGSVFSIVLFMVLLNWFFYMNPGAIPDFIPFQDRLLVWADIENHRQSGNQLLMALKYGGEGGWYGLGFGMNDRVLSLPMVQNDFVLTFWLNRFGGLSALFLATIQIYFILTLVRIAQKLKNKRIAGAEHTEDSRRIQHSFILILLGMACLQAFHWAISWGNALGLLPVMGQPMTWLSSGISHQFFGFTILMVSMTIAWIDADSDPRDQ